MFKHNFRDNIIKLKGGGGCCCLFKHNFRDNIIKFRDVGFE